MDVQPLIFLFGLLVGYFLSGRTSPFVALLFGGFAVYAGFYFGGVTESFATYFGLGVFLPSLLMLLKRHGGSMSKALSSGVGALRKVGEEKKKELQELRKEVGDLKQIERELAGFYKEVRETALEEVELDKEVETALAGVEKELEEVLKVIKQFFQRAYSLWGRLNRREALVFWRELTQQVKEHLLKAMEKLETVIRDYVAGVKKVREKISELDVKTDGIAKNLADLRERLVKTARLEIKSFEQVGLVLERIEVKEYEDLAQMIRVEHGTLLGFGRAAKMFGWGEAGEEEMEREEREMGSLLETFPRLAREIKADIEEIKGELEAAKKVDLGKKVEAASKLLLDVQGKLAGKNDIESKALGELDRVEEEVKQRVKKIYSGYVEAAIKERFGPDTALRAFWSGLEKVEEEILPSLRAVGRISSQMAIEYRNVGVEVEKALSDVESSLDEAVTLDTHMESTLKKARGLIKKFELLERTLLAAKERAGVHLELGEKILADLRAAKEIWSETVRLMEEERETVKELAELKKEIDNVKMETKKVFEGIIKVLDGVAEKVGGEALIKEFRAVKARVARVIVESLKEIEALKRYLSEEVRREELAKAPAR